MECVVLVGRVGGSSFAHVPGALVQADAVQLAEVLITGPSGSSRVPSAGVRRPISPVVPASTRHSRESGRIHGQCKTQGSRTATPSSIRTPYDRLTSEGEAGVLPTHQLSGLANKVIHRNPQADSVVRAGAQRPG